MAIKPCPLCSDPSARYERIVNGVALVRCDGCGFVFADLADRQILEANAALGDSVLARYEQIQTRIDQLWFARIAERLGRPGGRALDVGCGNGVLVEAFTRRACQAEGLDPSVWARAAAAQKGFVLHDSYAEDQTLPAASYDVVTSTSTFEHIPRPVEHLRSLLRLIRPGGVLYMCGMPNYGSWAVRVGLASFRHNRPPWHANFFTPRTLRAVFERAVDAGCLAQLRIRTYGVPEAHHVHQAIAGRRAARRRPLGSQRGVVDGTAGLPVQRLAAALYDVLGRPLQLGDKLEVRATRSQAAWSPG